MITIKLFNVIHQDRRNQNTTFNIFGIGKDYGFVNDMEISEEFLLKNLSDIKPANVKLQKNTSLKILNKTQEKDYLIYIL